jgi:hypothetical protein
MKAPEFLEVLQEMREAGVYGINHFALYDNLPHTTWEVVIFENLPTTTISLDYFKEHIQEIENRELAESILVSLLHKDMAYSVEMMTLEKARILTRKFFSLFSSHALYFSNSTWNENEYAVPAKAFELGLSSWAPLTELTFDSGIIICDNNRIGIAWFSDDD